MFCPSEVKLNYSKPKVIKFNMFDAPQQSDKEEGEVDARNSVLTYNFSCKEGRLLCGYGVRELQMPTSTTDLSSESVIPVNGDEVRALWSFTWYESTGDELKYYLFYFNDQHKFCYDNIFNIRPLPLSLQSQFTSTPVGINYRINGKDYMIFSSADCNTFVFGDGYQQYLENGPKLVSLCSHNDKLFAITGKARRSLVFTDNLNILEWDNSKTKHLEFGDDRGNLTKVISFDDYVYVFREFGITKVSTYATSGELSVSHIFQSSSYIYPGSIASDGENIYFMTRDGFYKFNGSKVTRIELGNFNMFEDNSNCSAICFESKYMLASRMKFNDGQTQGCEAAECGYVNNAIFIYNVQTQKVEIVRGVDVKQLLALNNPYKCKVVMCFNNANIDKLGELVTNGKVFGTTSHKVWESPLTDLGQGDNSKKVEFFTIKTNCDCVVTIVTEKTSRQFKILPKSVTQHIKAGVCGKKFKFRIETDGSEGTEISNFQVSVR